MKKLKEFEKKKWIYDQKLWEYNEWQSSKNPRFS